MSDDFLSRWSRRKRAAGAPPAESPAAPAEPELTPDEIAALPKPEDLTAESDFAAFLRKGVPELLRNAALRRMWALDPAIRDFEGPARDYAWDWNIPGGVPGNGPLAATDDVGAMLRGLFGDERDRVADGESTAAPKVECDAAPPQEAAPLPQPADAAAAASGDETRNPESQTLAAVQEEPPPRPARRRHGGATPV